MPRSRGSEVAQRQSPRVPLHLKTTVCSEANGVVRHSVDRSSPKIDERRSPRSPLHVHEKKRGTRVADLETKLAQTQDELKKLKEQLADSEAAKRDAQHELEETKIQIQIQTHLVAREEETSEPEVVAANVAEESVNSPATTDVFEVVATATSTQTESNQTDEAESGKDEREESEEMKAMIEDEAKEQEEELSKNSVDATVDVSEELNVKLLEKEKEIETLLAENESLRNQMEDAREKAAASQAKEEKMSVKLANVDQEMREFRRMVESLEEKVEAAEGAKVTLEGEMKKLRVQTEQWRKAAEEAAAVLSGGGEGIGRRVGDRCGSMDKHLHLGGYGGGVGFVGLPGMEEDGGKRRGGGGMKMFGELWKKKGQK